MKKYMCFVALLALLPVSLFAANGSDVYLALGDSVAFGYDPTISKPKPQKFIGYPEYVSKFDRIVEAKKLVNASCPGETSGSFLSSTAPDNHCRDFRASIGLHEKYPGTQMAFALSQLAGKKDVKLVTLNIGGNDLELLRQACAAAPSFPDCVLQRLGQVLQAYGQNLATILYAIRVQAGYTGKLVLVTQYSPSADPLFQQAVGALNSVLTQVGSQFGALFADGSAAFQIASLPFGGDPCAAGLLVRLGPGLCDQHPSTVGSKLLAATVLLTLVPDLSAISGL